MRERESKNQIINSSYPFKPWEIEYIIAIEKKVCSFAKQS